jgi:hypothetical protein
MTDYTKATNFATKDALVTGDPLKVVKGTEIDDEFNAIEDSIETKADLASPTFTGVPKAPTAAAGTNTTQLATTAFVKTELTTISISIGTDELEDGSVTQAKLADDSVGSAQIIDNSVTADELDVSGDGVVGQFLISDGDGSFSWETVVGAPTNGTDVGAVRMFGQASGQTSVLGTVSGSSLRWGDDISSVLLDYLPSNYLDNTPSGTWRLVGPHGSKWLADGFDRASTSLWVRIS